MASLTHLVQEIAMDLSPVNGTVRNMTLHKVTLKNKKTAKLIFALSLLVAGAPLREICRCEGLFTNYTLGDVQHEFYANL